LHASFAKHDGAFLCHPESERAKRAQAKDLGQLRASETGTGFEIAKRSYLLERA